MITSSSYKDGGWAWMVVLGGFIVNFLVVGTAVKSFGILYVELMEKYDSPSGVNITIVAVTQSLCLLLGPLTNMLAMRITCQKTVFLGGILMCSGFILSMFAPELIYLYFTYGMIVGVGASMAYSPSLVLVGQYFEKRRALANGLSTAGSGVGNFAIPPLIRLLVDTFGSLSSALLILGAIMLHICVAALLLRPIPVPKSTKRETSRNCVISEMNCDKKGNEIEASSDPHGVSNDLGKIDVEDCSKNDRNSSHGHHAGSGGHNSIQQMRDLFRNAVFWLYALSVMLMFCGYPTLYVVLPQHSQKHLEISKKSAAYLVSILGMADLVGRIGFGFVADYNLVPKRYIFTVCTAMSGIGVCILPFVNDYVGLAVLLSVIGLFAGGFFALIAVMLAEKLGIARLHSAFGLVVMFMGASFIFAAPISGVLNDRTGKWTASFLFSGISMLVGSTLLLLDPVAVKYEQKKAQRIISSQ